MKISPLTILIVGIALGVAALSFGIFWYLLPNAQETGYYTDYRDKLQAEADKMPLAIKRVEQAQATVDSMKQQWDRVVFAKTPGSTVATGGINLAANRYQLTVDARKFRDNVQRAVNAQLHKGGVKVVSGVQVPTPPETENAVVESYFNYPALPFPVCVFDLGTVTVQGSFGQICQHMKAWANMPHYIAVASGLRLDGTSPQLTGTYNLTVVALIRGNKISPEITGVAAPSATAGGLSVPAGAFTGGPPPLSGRAMQPPQARGGAPAAAAGGRSIPAPVE